MSRNARKLAGFSLVLAVLGSSLFAPACSTAEAGPLEVTYYYLPG